MIIEDLIYPTAVNGQLQNPETKPLSQIIGMLQLFEKSRPGLRVRNWPAGPIEVFTIRETTPLEDAQAKLADIRQILLNAGRNALPPEIIAELLRKL